MNRLNVLLIENDLNITLMENSLKDPGFIYLKAKYSNEFLALPKEKSNPIL